MIGDPTPNNTGLFGTEIASDDLTPADIPGPDASEDELHGFAYTLNGYRVAGSVGRCGEIALSPNHESIDELRIAMFFHLRMLHHTNQGFDDFDAEHLRRLTGRIRELVQARDPGRKDGRQR